MNDIIMRLESRLAELEEQVRPRPMDEAPEHDHPILIRSGDAFFIATWRMYRDRWGEKQGPVWVNESDLRPVVLPDCWWPLPEISFREAE